jgi:hypothetical protein
MRYYRKVGEDRIFFEVRNFNGVLVCNCDMFMRTRTCTHTDDVANNNIYVEEESRPVVSVTQLNAESRKSFYQHSARYKITRYIEDNAIETICEYNHKGFPTWKDDDFRCATCGKPMILGLNRVQIQEVQSLLTSDDTGMWQILEDMKLVCL